MSFFNSTAGWIRSQHTLNSLCICNVLLLPLPAAAGMACIPETQPPTHLAQTQLTSSCAYTESLT